MSEFDQCISEWADRYHKAETANAALRAKVSGAKERLR